MKRRQFLLLGSLGLLGVRQAAAQFVLSDNQLNCLAQQLFQYECGGQKRQLVWWSPHEAFPSLGVGHFIWLPKGLSVPFEQTFPQLIRFLAKEHAVPDWLKTPYAPWPNRGAWLEEGESKRIVQLRAWLWHTRKAQAEFVLTRFNERWAQACRSQADGDLLTQRMAALIAADPRAQWAVLDYSNFKGFGDSPAERYQGVGWGLVQVIRHMNAPSLPAFVAAAEKVLQQRIQYAPQDERRWWPGWQKRIHHYLRLNHDCA